MYQCFYEFEKKQLIVYSSTKTNATIKVNDNVFYFPELKKELIACEIPITNTIYINNEKIIVPILHIKKPLIEELSPSQQIIQPKNLDGLNLIKVTNNPYITTYGLTGKNYKIGIVDGGAVYKHYEFSNSDRVKYQETPTIDDHATHVAGTCTSYGYDAQSRGVAREANIYLYTFDNWENSLRQCGINGYNSCNNSWGYIIGWNGSYYYGLSYEYYIANYKSGLLRSPNFGKYSIYSRDLDTISKTYNNLFMCFAAGNDRNDIYSGGTWYILSYNTFSWIAMNPTTYPPPKPDGDYNSIGMLGSAKNVLTVGATVDSSITSTWFSNWGPTNDNRIKPEIMANGESVYSTLASGYTAYGRYSGTSMATPFATGCGCLIQQFIQEQLGYFPESALVKACLIHGASATEINAKNGYGLINMENTLKFLDYVKQQNIFKIQRETMTNSKTVDSFTFNNLGTGSFVATLCYNDIEGTPQTDYSSTQVIVNRLALYIENNGTYYYPYRLESQTTNAVMKTSSSSYNESFVYDWDNTQKILIPAGLTGTVSIYVKRMNILNGDQKYVLLISNNFENINNNMGDITVDDITMTGNIIKNDSNLQLTLNNNNSFRIINGNGSISIGSLNSNFFHFYTDRPKYYFNKSVHIDGSLFGYNNNMNIITPNNFITKIQNSNGSISIGSLNSNFFHFYTDRPKYYFNKSIYIDGSLFGYNNNMNIITPNNFITKIQNSNGFVSIGSVNTAFCHFYTDRPKYYFNKTIEIDGSINSYNRDLQLNPNGSVSNGMIIKKDTGYVGIKTQNPTQALEVNGYVKATGYFNFAGLHESYFKKENKVEIGQLVVSSGLTKNNLVIVEPSTKLKQKNIYGIVENILDGGDNNIAFVKCVGQGKLSVIGPIESGDLITSSNIKGVGVKQDSDIIYNYTLAKALENSNEIGKKIILVQFLC
jgi:hypothetical protein